MTHNDLMAAISDMQVKYTGQNIQFEVLLSSGEKLKGIPLNVKGQPTLMVMEGGDPAGPIYFSASDVVAIQPDF